MHCMFFLLNQFSGLFFYIACATRPLWHWQLHKIQMSSCYLARILVALATKYRAPRQPQFLPAAGWFDIFRKYRYRTEITNTEYFLYRFFWGTGRF
jgi:hypothetical protein